MDRMNCGTGKETSMAAFALTMLALFILTSGAALPLQAQTDPIKGAPLTTANWLQSGYNAAHVGYNPLEKTLSTANVSQLTQTWDFSTNAQIIVPSLISGKTVFVDSTDGNLYALNASTGALLWKFSGTDPSDAFGATPQGMAISGSTIYVNCQIDELNGGHSGVCALKATTGELLWDRAIYNDGRTVSSGPLNGPVVSNGIVVLGETDQRGGYVVGLNAKTGALVWQIGDCAGGASKRCQSITPYPAAVSNGVVYYGAFGMNNFAGVCAVELASGATKWCSQTGDNGSPAAVSGNTVYVNTFSGTLYAFDAKTGDQIWTVTGLDCGNDYNRPTVAKGVLYIGGTYYGLQYALSAKTGKLLWTSPGSNDFTSGPSLANGVIYAQCYGTCALDAATGAILWQSPQGRNTSSQPMVANGTLYGVCSYNNECAYNLPKGEAKQ
jgi:outer membrane protein assembly factor BamB